MAQRDRAYQIGDGGIICLIRPNQYYNGRVCLSLDANGGTLSPTQIMCKGGNSYGTLPIPYREGYTFSGWFTSADGGMQITDSSLVPYSNMTLYAHWTPVTAPI